MGLRGSTPRSAEMPKGTGEYSLEMADGVGWWNSNLYVVRLQFLHIWHPRGLQRLRPIIQCDEWTSGYSWVPPSIKQPLRNLFIRYQHLQVVLHRLLYCIHLTWKKIGFKVRWALSITWLCVTCKGIAMWNVMLYATSCAAWMSKL